MLEEPQLHNLEHEYFQRMLFVWTTKSVTTIRDIFLQFKEYLEGLGPGVRQIKIGSWQK